MRAAAAMFSAAVGTVTMRICFFETKWSETVKNTP